MELTERQRRLLWELVTMIDIDTLNQNLDLIKQEETDDEELKALAKLLDPDGELDKAWATHPLQP